jgi:UDP-N-acetylmuramyl-tripeptide synthetase
LIARLQTVSQASQWLRQRVGSGALRTDSRRIQAGDGFIAWPGAAVDGRRYVHDALRSGAKACLVEADGAEEFAFDGEQVAAFQGLKAGSGAIAAEYFGHPSQRMDIVAITGTNGKTSSAWWLAQACNALQKREHASEHSCGLIGTFGIGVPGAMVPTGLTTPDPVTLQAELARMLARGIRSCAMEASSIGLVEHRLAGTQVKVAVFTNFTQDHLDYHGDMHSYWLAKRMLFDIEGLHTAVINLDDPKGDELARYCASKGLRLVTVSQDRTDASLRLRTMALNAAGMSLSVEGEGKLHELKLPILGEYNAMNMLGVLGALQALGHELTAACASLEHCTAVPGRMECLSAEGAPLAVVDYAHTPDALEKALQALRPTARQRGGQLWCVFGCGGNRDAAKRPLMARAAQRSADQVVVTSDNPRMESPQLIAQHIMAGFEAQLLPQPVLELDRARAIAWSISQARPQDVVLITGKGHEDYQETAGVRQAFSDQEHAKRALAQRPAQERT